MATQQSIDGINDLLKSGDIKNIEIAFSIIESQGISYDFSEIEALFEICNTDKNNACKTIQDKILYCYNLKKLYLSNNGISDLSFLSELVSIEDLNIERNNISDLSPFSSLTNLKRIHLNHNNISDLSPLSSLTNLQYINLRNNKIHDLSPLSSLTNLQYLDVRNNRNLAKYSAKNTLCNCFIFF